MSRNSKFLAAFVCAGALVVATSHASAESLPAEGTSQSTDASDELGLDDLIAVSPDETSTTTQPAATEPEGPAEAQEPATIPVAQKSDVPAEPLKDPNPSRQIEEIVVTATKREASLREIPVSISAISGESLESRGQLNLADYIQKTPGVTVTQSYAGLARFSIRGISTETVPTSPLPTPVGFFIGDSAFTDPYIASIIPDLSAFDLAGVQVLKGPQGTLFGGAALSGAIRYELQDPVQGEWQFRGFAQTVQPSGGSLAVTSGFAVNAPLLSDDSLALRLGYIRRNYPGVIDNTQTGEKDVDSASGNQYRAILLWEPQDWKIKYTHLSQDYDADDTAGGIVTSVEGNRENNLLVLASPAKNKITLDSLELGYEFESMRVVALSSYLAKDVYEDRDSTYTLLGAPPQGYPPLLGITQEIKQDSTAFSQEIRLQSTGADPLQWLLGGYYYTYEMDFTLEAMSPLTQPILGGDSALRRLLRALGLDDTAITDNLGLLKADSHVESSEKAVFFDLSYTLWDNLDLSAGARLYETTVKGGVLGSGLLIRASNNGMNSDSSAAITERGINPKFALTWRMTDAHSLYAQVAKGYRFGGIQVAPSTATNGVPPTFKSDTLWNHELGIRTSWLDRTLNADLTLFYIRYKDPIVNQSTQGIPLAYNDNVSSAISRGLEASLLWNTPVEGLNLSLTAALTDAYITAPFTASGNVQIEPGQEMPGTAPQQYGAAVAYLRPFGMVNVALNAGYNYVAQGYSNLQHDLEINGYDTVDAGIVFSTDAWSFRPRLALNVSNIFDEVVASSGQTGQAIVPTNRINVYGLIPPRTVSARISFDF